MEQDITREITRILARDGHGEEQVAEALLPEVYEYAVAVTGNAELRKTFALNALVSLDMALWKLYSRERGIGDFDEMIPAGYRPAFARHQDAVARLPVVGFHLAASDLRRLAEKGVFFFSSFINGCA